MSPPLPSGVVAIILGGGRGTRLFPLTACRSKPAVPLAGKFRLIDIPISNCINSGIRRIFVLTQFNSASLNRHVAQTYQFDLFSGGFVQIVAAEQTNETEMWFQGTADAVRKSMIHIADGPATHYLILAGDALYRMDLAELLRQHTADDADVTVCCKMVNEDDAQAFGIVGIDTTRRITSFHEKPKGAALPPLRANPDTIRAAGLPVADKPYLASMGIYLYNRDALLAELNGTTLQDFGKEIIPQSISRRRVFAHLFDGYWEDIGTIKAFYQANLDLLRTPPPFDFYDPDSPIFTHARTLPCSEVEDSHIQTTMLAEGCLIRRAEIRNCVIGIRSVIREGAQLENSVMMGADLYDRYLERAGSPHDSADPKAPIPIGIGRGAIVRNAIIDKNACIGPNTRITNARGVTEEDGPGYAIRDGIVIIPKGATIPAGTVI